jgi:hypothetical protein
MNSLTCEKCGTANPSNVKFCKQCGNQLTLGSADSSTFAPEPPKVNPAARAPISIAGSSTAAQNGTRYGALRGIAGFCRLMGFIFVGLNGLVALYGIYALFANSFLSGLATIVGAAIGAGIAYIFWNIIAESISVLLDIEENTRRSAELLAERF